MKIKTKKKECSMATILQCNRTTVLYTIPINRKITIIYSFDIHKIKQTYKATNSVKKVCTKVEFRLLVLYSLQYGRKAESPKNRSAMQSSVET